MLMHMSTKTITITDAAYARLAQEKRPGESFTKVILRLTQRRSLFDLHKVVSRKEADALAEAVLEMRDERMRRRDERLGGRRDEATP